MSGLLKSFKESGEAGAAPKIDYGLIRLQYEILGTPVSELARQAERGEQLILDAIENEGWEQWWPDCNLYCRPNGEVVLTDFEIASGKIVSANETLQEQASIYKLASATRIAVYEAAKNEYLIYKYSQLEAALVDKAEYLVRSCDPDAAALRFLGTLIKDLRLTFNSTTRGSGATLEIDKNGLPTVILQDVVGRHFIPQEYTDTLDEDDQDADKI